MTQQRGTGGEQSRQLGLNTVKMLWIQPGSSHDFNGLDVLIICVCKASAFFHQGCVGNTLEP